jgi:arylsulfatase A-like enzyme
MGALAGGAAACALPRVVRAQGNPAPESPPNFVLIMADDLGYGDLGCYSAPDIKTPHLDALAAGGARLTQFYVSCPVCSPTRAGLLTGRYQQRCGITGVLTTKTRADGMDPSEITMADMLKGAGYATGIFGKWHLGYAPERGPTKQGFDVHRGFIAGNVDYFAHIDNTGKHDWWHNGEEITEEGYLTTLITDHAIRFMEENRERPFLLYVPHGAPHSPYQGPGDADTAGKRPGGGREKYVEMVEAIDDEVGRIVASLRRLGLERDTLVIFLSDNGGTGKAGRNDPLSGTKGTLLEGGIREPFIANWPGTIAPSQTIDDVAISLDILPTFLDAANTQAPAGRSLDGVSLLPLLTGQERLGERTLFWGYKDHRAVRKGDWKLLIRGDDPPKLFNLEDDIAEKSDLSAQQPKRVQALTEALRAWEKDVGA